MASDDPMVAWACRLFAGILRRPVTEIDPAQDFQRQGGDSLLAMELSLRLREAGLALEPGELAHDSAPVAIARRFAHPTHTAPSRWEPVVVLRPGSEGFPPLVLIHATPGDVLGYGNLAAELPDEVPCWGVVSRVLHEPQHPHRSIPEMAADYLRALQTRLLGKPFSLGGWCYGGLVAYEMACALERAGHPAPLRLLLLETWSPPPAAFALRLQWRVLQLRTLLGQPRGKLAAYLRHKVRWRRRADPVPAASTPRRDAAVAHNLAAAACYRAGSYRLPVDLFLTPDQGTDVLPLPEGGWSVLAPSRTIHACAGDHADLLHPPHVAGLAGRITKRLGVKP
jgi:thioesterase domain-containing protein/aryl carrier-like protein